MNLTLVVLAAGIGNRYGGLKQMDPVGPSGEFLLDYAVYDALRAGFDRVVFVIRRAIAADFDARVGARIARRVDTVCVMQELDMLPPGRTVPPDRTKPWGTAHAVLAARAAVDAPFAVINADDFYGREAYAALAGFLDAPRDDDAHYAMVGYPLRNVLSDHGSVARGICERDTDGNLVSVVERTEIEPAGDGARFRNAAGGWTPLPGGAPTSMNFWGFKPGFFRHLEAGFAAFLAEFGHTQNAEYFVPTEVNRLIREGTARVRVLAADSPWFGVTYAPDKPRVVARIRALIAAGVYPDDLWG
jgi:hypothetical protein